MKRLIPLLIILAACGDGGEGGRRVLEPSRLRIVAGDAQTSPVAASTAAGAVFRVYAAGDAATGVLPDTLITEIQGTVQGRDGVMGVGGNVELPPGTSVEYTVLQDGCGAPYIASVNPDSDARARTLWEIPGARQNLTPVLQGLQWHVVGGDSVWASRCEMEARLKVGAEFRADTSFVAYFEPGPAVAMDFGRWAPEGTIGGIVPVGPPNVYDAYFNAHAPGVGITITGPEGRLLEEAPSGHPPYVRTLTSPTEERYDTLSFSGHGLSATVVVPWLQDIGPGWTYEVVCGAGKMGPRSEAIDTMRMVYTLVGTERETSLPWPFDNSYERSSVGTAIREYYVEFTDPGVESLDTTFEGTAGWLNQSPGRLQLTVYPPRTSSWLMSGLVADGPGHYVGTGEAICTNPISETFSAP